MRLGLDIAADSNPHTSVPDIMWPADPGALRGERDGQGLGDLRRICAGQPPDDADEYAAHERLAC